jgi:AcrR family transcriptional regulator
MSADARDQRNHDPAPAPAQRHGTNDAKPTQRERLLESVVELTARAGYSNASIAQIIAQAGVSRPTFYAHFPDKQASFLAAVAAIHERLLARVDAAVEQGPPQRASYLAIQALFAFVTSSPVEARVLIDVILTAGPDSLDARDATVRAIARIVDAAYRGLPDATSIPDLPTDVLVGGVLRLLGSRMRSRQPLAGPFLTDLFDWISSYEVPITSRRWSSVDRRSSPAPSSFLAEIPFSSPPPTRPDPRSRRQATEDTRQRLLFATGAVVRDKGLTATTVADIARRAGLDHRTFTRLFKDKHAAFLSFHELAYRRTLALTVGAYFSRAGWPERVWAAGAAFTGFLQVNPAIARLGFVESYALGPRTARRMDDLLDLFTIFLQDGYAAGQGSRRPSRLAIQAIAATIFECAYAESRQHDSSNMPELLPYGVFVALTPFLGPAATNTFIERELIPGVPS